MVKSGLMRLRSLLLLFVLAFGAMPAFGQEIDETLVSPVPPPRPVEFGGTSQPGDSEDGAGPDAAIDGVEPGTGPTGSTFPASPTRSP